MASEKAKDVLTTQKTTPKVVFSFSLFGDGDKYTIGMVKNCELIRTRFPDAKVYIYLANDVPSPCVDVLKTFSNVKIINIERRHNLINMMDRFLAIDDPETDIMFVRDADSRVHARDASCVEDFIKSDKALHIIRDHRKHWGKIMGGMFAIRKSLFPHNMGDLIKTWMDKKERGINGEYGCDMHFTNRVLHPLMKHSALIQDPHHHFKEEIITPIRHPIKNNDYVGRVAPL
jgi:hypothetical protein